MKSYIKDRLIAGLVIAAIALPLMLISKSCNGQKKASALFMTTVSCGVLKDGNTNQFADRFSPSLMFDAGGWVNNNIAITGRLGVCKLANINGTQIPLAIGIIAGEKNYKKLSPVFTAHFGFDIYKKTIASVEIEGKEYYNIAAGVKLPSGKKGNAIFTIGYSNYSFNSSAYLGGSFKGGKSNLGLFNASFSFLL